jgi:hypothetical protein
MSEIVTGEMPSDVKRWMRLAGAAMVGRRGGKILWKKPFTLAAMRQALPVGS